MRDNQQVLEKHKTSFIALTVVIILLALLASYWVISTSYVSVGKLNNLELEQATQLLESNGVDYRVNVNGELLVSNENVTDSQLAIANLSKQIRPGKGMELFDNLDYSMTESAHNITLMRALQGELEKTLTSLSYIEAARVHLSLKEKKLFQENEKNSASVTVFTRNDYVLTAAQIDGVQSLVASSVENLKKESVKVFNALGTQISLRYDSDNPNLNTIGGENREDVLKQKVESLLSLYLPQKDFVVSVTLSYATTETNSVINSLIAKSNEQGFISEERRTIKAKDNRESSADTPTPTSETTEIKYLHGTRVDDIKSVERIIQSQSVAVAIVSEKALEHKNQLHEMIAAAVNLNTQRGDNISISVIPRLSSDESIPQAKQPPLVVNDSEASTSATPNIQFIQLFVLMFISFSIVSFLLVRKYRLSNQQRNELLIELNELVKSSPVNDEAIARKGSFQ